MNTETVQMHGKDREEGGREMTDEVSDVKDTTHATTLESSNHRTVYFDVLRIIAICAVVVLHVSAQNFVESGVDTPEWQALNFYDSIVRWSVPVFVMISGALFLDGENSIGKLYKKNIARILVAFIFWSMLYAVKNMIFTDCGWQHTIKQFLLGYYHMWFLFMIVGLYMIVPLLKPIVKSMELTKYFLLLSVAFTYVIPQTIQLVSLKYPAIASLANGMVGKVYFYFTLGFASQFVCGYYLSKVELGKRAKIVVYFLSICGFLATIVGTSMLSVSGQKANEMLYGYLTVNVMLEAVGIFVLMKDIFERKAVGVRIEKVLGLLAKYSFGAYLVHVLVLDELGRIFGLNTLSFNPLLSIPVISMIVIVISFVISAALNHIPLLKKTV